MMKRCGACKRERPIGMFGRDARTPSGLNCACKECLAAQRSRRRPQAAAQQKAWREANPDRAREAVRRAWAANKDQYLAQHREYVRQNAEALAARRKELRAARADIIREQKRASRLRNIEAAKERDRRYYAANAERAKANAKAWALKNAERHRLNKQLNQAQRSAAGDLTARQWKEICLFYGNACALCRVSATEKPLTVDHYIPIVRGGTHDWKNTWPLCLRCNQTKHMRVPTGAPPHVTVLMITTKLQKEA